MLYTHCIQTACACNASIADKDIQTAKCRNCTLNQRLKALHIGNVALGKYRLIARCHSVELGSRLTASLFVKIGNHNICSVADKALGNTLTKALRSTSDDENLILYTACACSLELRLMCLPIIDKDNLLGCHRMFATKRLRIPGNLHHIGIDILNNSALLGVATNRYKAYTLDKDNLRIVAIGRSVVVNLLLRLLQNCSRGVGSNIDIL